MATRPARFLLLAVSPLAAATPGLPEAPDASRAECDAPRAEWIWCDDFERDRTGRYFEYDDAGGRFRRASGAGYRGSTGMRVEFAAGAVSAGSLHLAFGRTPARYIRPVDDGTADYREVFWRVYVRLEPGWVGGGGYKLSRAQILASPEWAQAMIAPVWSGAGRARSHLVLDPFTGVDERGALRTARYNDQARLRPLGAAPSATPVFAPERVGQWLCVEAHVRLNDPGRSNGVFELWIDGRPEASRTGLDWVRTYDGYGINTVFLENYWNGGSPRRQSRVIDQLVVSTARIGCLP